MIAFGQKVLPEGTFDSAPNNNNNNIKDNNNNKDLHVGYYSNSNSNNDIMSRGFAPKPHACLVKDRGLRAEPRYDVNEKRQNQHFLKNDNYNKKRNEAAKLIMFNKIGIV